MEKRFENHYERTPAVIKELFCAIYFKRIGTLIIYLVLGAVAVVSVVKGIRYGQFQISGCAGIIVFALMQLVMYNNSVKNAIARDRVKFGNEPLKVHTVVSDEGIQCTYGEKTVDPIPVSEIKKVFTTKNLIMLHTKSRLVMIFHKDNFTVGTQDEFLDYLRENGLKVKI